MKYFEKQALLDEFSYAAEDGSVLTYKDIEAILNHFDCGGDVGDVIELTPHGRLGDLDELKERATKRLYASNHGSMAEAYYAAIIDLIDEAPTIISADPAEGASERDRQAAATAEEAEE